MKLKLLLPPVAQSITHIDHCVRLGFASGLCGNAVKYAKMERENALLLERLCLIARPRSQLVKPKTFT